MTIEIEENPDGLFFSEHVVPTYGMTCVIITSLFIAALLLGAIITVFLLIPFLIIGAILSDWKYHCVIDYKEFKVYTKYTFLKRTRKLKIWNFHEIKKIEFRIETYQNPDTTYNLSLFLCPKGSTVLFRILLIKGSKDLENQFLNALQDASKHIEVSVVRADYPISVMKSDHEI